MGFFFFPFPPSPPQKKWTNACYSLHLRPSSQWGKRRQISAITDRSWRRCTGGPFGGSAGRQRRANLLLRLKNGCLRGCDNFMVRKGTKTFYSYFRVIIVQSALHHHPHFKLPFLKFFSVNYFRDVVPIISPAATRSTVNIAAMTPLRRKAPGSPLNPVWSTKCPIWFLYIRPRSSSAGPPMMWSLPGQRYLSASRELRLTGEDHRPVHKLITDTQKQQLYNCMSSNPTPGAGRMHFN